MRRSEFATFSEIPIDSVLSKVGKEVANAVARLPSSSLSASNEDDLAAEIASRFELNVPSLSFDSMTVEQSSRMVPSDHFPATFFVEPGKEYEKKTVIFRIPYAGDSTFLRCYDSTRSMSPASVYLDRSDVCFEVLSLRFDKAEIERDRDATLHHLQRFLPRVANAVESFNESLRGRIVGLIRQRKKEIDVDSDLLASLGTPVAGGSAPPTTLAVSPPVQRRTIRVSTAPAVPGRRPDPTLDERTYHDILSALSDYGKQMERTAATYSAMGEEDLRNHLLGLLQAGFPSASATGESFNRSGKTDILIRHENHNLFVAECKIWAGPSAYLAGISQLLAYLTWRDSKAALVLFVRNKDISKVVESVREATATHAQFAVQDYEREGVFRLRFSLPGDAGTTIHIAVLLFHLS